MTNLVIDVNYVTDYSKKEAEKVLTLPISSILPKKNGRRSSVNDDELWELSHSIKTYGIVQPVIVRALSMGTYELIAGERRIKAARLAGLKSVPCLVYENSCEDNSLILMSVLENVQRVNLSLVEEAKIYGDIVNRFGLDAQKLAKRLGKEPYEIEEKLKILTLPEEILKKMEEYNLSIFHAHSFLKIKDRALLTKAVTNVCVRHFDADKTEEYINDLLKEKEDLKLGNGSVLDVKILTNTINQIAKLLKNLGVDEALTINEEGASTEFIIKIPKTVC